MSAFLGVISALDLPARQAFMIEMVTREGLMSALRSFPPVQRGAYGSDPPWRDLSFMSGANRVLSCQRVSYLAVIVALLAMRIERHDVPGSGRSRQPIWRMVSATYEKRVLSESCSS